MTQEKISLIKFVNINLKNYSKLKSKSFDLNNLRDKKLYWRGEDKLGSTEFTFQDFLHQNLWIL